MTTIQKLQRFREALEKWKKNKGLEGQGGSWLASQRCYSKAAKPVAIDFGLSGFEIVLAEKIDKQVMEAK